LHPKAMNEDQLKPLWRGKRMYKDNSSKDFDIEKGKTPNKSSLRLVVLVSLCVACYSLHGILVNLSRDEKNNIPYNSGTVILFSEICKLFISIIMLAVEDNANRLKIKFSLNETLWLALPGLIYMVNNNLAIQILDYIDPVTFQLLSNLKVLSTTLLSWFWLHTKFTRVQWVSLALLLVGSLMSTKTGEDYKLFNEVSNHMTLGATIRGLCLMLLYCFLSGVAGIATEYIMKLNEKTSLHFQNAQLYVFGIIFNIIAMFYQSEFTSDFLKGIFNFWTIVVILNQSFTGLFLSAIMKYMDNITKLFIIAGATLVSYGLSYVLFGVQTTLNYVYACIIVGISVYLYNMKNIHGEEM
jgi:probable UDP-sugar transporter A4